ncbi:hypothetical protein Pan216_26680 [Planctomycetes bacterium Pan216]|uniref:SLA1 homology domain-containing protein n=1 Tax=Kolteria novifilia TaxID=2527975 RepID=A0A518B477_9BACT|nr:hypothetical protein Pan216_26680 [Planctomycetes bacterium Pan216]
MAHRLLVMSLAVACVSPAMARAGLNIGMKLACKKYGDAWKTRNQRAMLGVTTSDFGRQWARMPREAFVTLPRYRDARVLSSSKGNGHGTVTISTPDGPCTLVLVGRGFNWRVTDIRKNMDGQNVSLKSYLDVSLTAREFMVDLKNRGGSSFHDSITGDFRHSFRQLSATELNQIRSQLPPIDPNLKPRVRFHGSQAIVQTSVVGPTGSPRTATFTLHRQGGWRVHDYSVRGADVEIASFRESLPLLARVSSFGEFVKNPSQHEPKDFVADGQLRELLTEAKSEANFPLKMEGERDRLEILGDGRTAEISYPDRVVRIHASHENGRCLIDRVEVCKGDKTNCVASLLNLRRQVKQLSFASAFGAFGVASTPSAAPTALASADSAPEEQEVTEVAMATETDEEVGTSVASVSHDEVVVSETSTSPVVYEEVVVSGHSSTPVVYEEVVHQPIRQVAAYASDSSGYVVHAGGYVTPTATRYHQPHRVYSSKKAMRKAQKAYRRQQRRMRRGW